MRSFAPLLALLAAAGCSSSSQSAGQSDGGIDAGDLLGCNDDPRAQSYSPGMGQMGQGKVFRFILEKASPAPVTTGTEIWTLKLVDASGAAVTDATFPVMYPWMPEHRHGTATVTVTNNHDGTYTLDPMYLYMAGLWEIDITAQSGSSKDTATFFFCL